MFRSKIMRLRYSGGGDRGYGEINWGFETTCDISRARERERERVNVERFCGATVIGSRFGGSFRTNGSNKPYSHW